MNEKILKKTIQRLVLSLVGLNTLTIIWLSAFEPPEAYLASENLLNEAGFLADDSVYLFSFFVLIMLAYIIALFLTFRLKEIGRVLYVFSLGLLVLSSLLLGYNIFDPLTLLLDYLTVLLEGALLVLLLLPDSKRIFSKGSPS